MSEEEISKSKSVGSAGRWPRRFLLLTVLAAIVASIFYLLRREGVDVAGALETVSSTSAEAATTARVKAALALSRKVSAFDVDVETSGETVELHGVVPSREVKELAVAVAEDTSGAKRVVDALMVDSSIRPNLETQRLRRRVEDLELQSAVHAALLARPEIATQELEVHVDERVVTLEGKTGSAEVKARIEGLVAAVKGVRDVDNRIDHVVAAESSNTTTPSLAKRVEFGLYATGAFDMDRIKVTEEEGVVTLRGEVGSRAEKLLAERIARDVEGTVEQVHNKLDIVPSEDESTST